MELRNERREGVLIASASDRVDSANVHDFQEALQAVIDERDRAVVLDLEHLTYISSAGLRVILLTAKALQKQNGGFAVCSLSDPIREVFEISGFDKIIPVYASQSNAIELLTS